MSEDGGMMSNRERLVYMVNQIARNFAAMHHDHAVEAVADHLASYWDPRMKAQIAEVLATAPDTLSAVSRAAVARLGRGAPAPQTRATAFNAVDEAGHSDAG